MVCFSSIGRGALSTGPLLSSMSFTSHCPFVRSPGNGKAPKSLSRGTGGTVPPPLSPFSPAQPGEPHWVGQGLCHAWKSLQRWSPSLPSGSASDPVNPAGQILDHFLIHMSRPGNILLRGGGAGARRGEVVQCRVEFRGKTFLLPETLLPQG